MMEDRAKTELICSQCHKTASVNTPGIDSAGRILCHNCLRDSRDGVMRYGIEQRSNSFGDLVPTRNPEFFLNGHTLRFRIKEVWRNVHGKRFGYSHPLWEVSAWINDGASFPIDEDERVMFIVDPKEYFQMIQRFEDQGLFRCTTCHKDLPLKELGGRPLFAGKVCKPCWAKHLEFLECEKKAGHTCSRCRQPYGNCSC